jgi:hypothetical protein
MVELYLALAVMLAVAAACGCAAWWAGRRSRRWGTAIAIFGAGVLAGHAWWWNDDPRWAAVLPVAWVMAAANLAPIGMALLAGAAAGALRTPAWQRAVLIVPLVGLGLFRTYEPLLGRVPALKPARWTDGVARQSTTSTCAAAACATALAAVGVASDEAEMAALCLTTDAGTRNLGIYRGLHVKARGTGVRVAPFKGDADALLATRPEVAVVVITSVSSAQPSPTWLERAGLAPRGMHAVALLGVGDDGKVDIGDPFAGRQRWKAEEFRRAFAGVGFILRGSSEGAAVNSVNSK